MKQFGLYKKQKLCSARDIEALFVNPAAAEFSRLAYPLRVVARNNPSRGSDAPIAFLISVPKKRLRHAVDRVKMRRRIREAFRLNHAQYPLADGLRVDVAFIYVADRLTSYRSVERAVRRLLDDLSSKYAPTETASSSPAAE